MIQMYMMDWLNDPMNLLSKVLATFFGVGYFPIAPGTLTSLIVVVLYRLFLYKLNWPIYLTIVVVYFFVGVYVSNKYSKKINQKDPSNIVIDEAFGQLLVLFRQGTALFPLFLCFFIFRVLDIIKPPPIRKLENFSGGWGIMTDDLLAAIYTGIIVNFYLIVK